GLLGGLAVGLAGARNARRSDLVRDDDFTHPDQLLTKHADNFAIPVSDILDPKIEPEGKYMSYGKNSGRWRFTRRGASEETVVLFDSSADAGRRASCWAVRSGAACVMKRVSWALRRLTPTAGEERKGRQTTRS